MFATFMEVLDTTVVNVSLPHIAGSLSVSVDEAAWALTSYLVANAIILPMTGWLANFFGRKRMLMAAVIGFTTASFFCGLAPTLPILILFRVIQGATGGAEFLDDVGQVGVVHLFQLGVGNVEAQAAQRVGFDHVGELPGDGAGRYGALQAADPGGRQYALEHAAQDAANADIDVHHVERIAHAIEQDAHGDVVDADHLAAGDIDDLLVEQVAGDAQKILVVMVRDKDFLAELDAFGERNGVHLIEAYGEPGVGATHQEAVDAGGVDKGDHGGVLDPADAAAFEVHHRHGQQFREIEEILRHRKRPSPRPMRAPRLGRKFDSNTERSTRLLDAKF